MTAADLCFSAVTWLAQSPPVTHLAHSSSADGRPCVFKYQYEKYNCISNKKLDNKIVMCYNIKNEYLGNDVLPWET